MDYAQDYELSGTRTLVVEDDFFVAQALAQTLSKLGCDVVGPVANVKEACNLAKQAEIDVALLDVVISGGNSEPVARVLISRKCPFLFLTGFRDVDMLSDDLHAYARLRKPVDAEKLRLALVETRASGATNSDRA